MVMLEREEKIEVTEERTPPPSDSQAGNCFYFDICGSEPDSPVNEGKPRCMQPFPCVFKYFSAHFKSSEMCIRLLELLETL